MLDFFRQQLFGMLVQEMLHNSLHSILVCIIYIKLLILSSLMSCFQTTIIWDASTGNAKEQFAFHSGMYKDTFVVGASQSTFILTFLYINH